jgi:acyl dehydratase
MPDPADHALLGPICTLEQVVTERDSETYALGVGLGDAPLDERDLVWFLDPNCGAFPTFATTLCHPRAHLKAHLEGIDTSRAVHAEQDLEIFATLPKRGLYSATSRLVECVDKGPGKGAMFRVVRDIHVDGGAAPVACATHVLFARGGGGFGGSPDAAHQLRQTPDRPPDRTIDIRSAPNLALIHRQSGDRNPLHVDPAHARRVGFDRPILHGLATYGLAARALCTNGRQVKRLAARFAAPFFPGDLLSVHIWDLHDNAVAFTGTSQEGRVTVLSHGVAAY